MKINRVKVLYKKTTYQIQAEEYKDPRFLELLEQNHESVARVRIAHLEHLSAIANLEKALTARGIRFDALARQDLKTSVSDVDLLISVGGDGTFLDASHHVLDTPVLGINSSTSSSVGHFCLATGENIEQVLESIIEGNIEPSPILRLSLTRNGELLSDLVLNEVLVSHIHPAATSRYIIEIDGKRDEQKSSGVWIGTPAGSTGSLRSAGGVVQSIIDDRFQFLVREPCCRPGETWHNLDGLLAKEQSVRIVSQMRTGALYIDGPHIEYGLDLGDTVEIFASQHSLSAFVDPAVNRMFESDCAARTAI